MRFDVLTAANKAAIFCDVTPGNCYLLLEGRRLTFHPEDRNRKFLRNVGNHLAD
jgi:hypothetical protein